MYEVGVVAHFEAAHRLTGDFGPATNLHGHTYRVEAMVRGDELKSDGTLLDVGLLDDVLKSAVGRLHYQNLDELPDLAGQNTTAEIIATYLHGRLAAKLRESPDLTLRVRVWESPHVFASYAGPLVPAQRAMTRRVALLTLGDPLTLSGGYLYHLRMAAMGPANGAEVRFFTFPERPFPLPALSAGWIRRRLDAWHPDAIVVDSIVAAFLNARSCKGLSCPLIGSLHQPPGGVEQPRIRAALQRRLDLQTYARCRLLIVASESLGKRLEEHAIPRDKIRVVPPGKDVAEPSGPARDLRLGRRAAAVCVANWLPAKGIVDLLDAAQRLEDDLVTLHLIGDTRVNTRYARIVWERIRHPALRDRVTVHGTMSPANVASSIATPTSSSYPATTRPSVRRSEKPWRPAWP